MKNLFCDNGGLDKIVRFLCEGQLDQKASPQLTDAMNIVCSCAFNNDGTLQTLKQNSKLISRTEDILNMSKKNNQKEFTRAAENLTWKLVKEDEFKQQQQAQLELKRQQKLEQARQAGKDTSEFVEEQEEDEHYDLMISYSWADMELAHRIFDYLTKNHSYKVWIDKEQMHGSTIGAMVSCDIQPTCRCATVYLF